MEGLIMILTEAHIDRIRHSVYRKLIKRTTERKTFSDKYNSILTTCLREVFFLVPDKELLISLQVDETLDYIIDMELNHDKKK
jgi:hypothetical protein